MLRVAFDGEPMRDDASAEATMAFARESTVMEFNEVVGTKGGRPLRIGGDGLLWSEAETKESSEEASSSSPSSGTSVGSGCVGGVVEIVGTVLIFEFIACSFSGFSSSEDGAGNAVCARTGFGDSISGRAEFALVTRCFDFSFGDCDVPSCSNMLISDVVGGIELVSNVFSGASLDELMLRLEGDRVVTGLWSPRPGLGGIPVRSGLEGSDREAARVAAIWEGDLERSVVAPGG